MANSRTDMSHGQQNGNDMRELEQMVNNFRVYELQHLLGYANRCRSGKKPELLQRALELIRTTKNLSVQQKVRELARRVPDRSCSMTSSADGTNTGAVNVYVPSPPYPSSTSYGLLSGGVSTFPGYAPTNAQGVTANSSSTSSAILHSAYRQNLSLYPDVKLTPLPFYDVLTEVVKPTTLVPMTAEKYQENYITFSLTQHQMAELAFHETDPLPRLELQLRFCLLNTTEQQKDDFPSGCNVRMNDKTVQLPNPIPTNKIGVEPKRPSRPVNVSLYCRPNIAAQRIQVTWNHDGTRHWTVSLYIVRHLTANILLDRLQAKGERPSKVSILMIKEKLSGDGDADIATTSLRVSLLCPLGKMRMRLPCRLQKCNHLQCFDGDLFLKMNEKRPTWSCPVCDKPTPFDEIQLDGYFLDVIEKTSDDESEVELYEDGSWAPIIEKEDKPSVVAEKRNAPDRNGALSSASPASAVTPSSSIRAASAETTSSSLTAKQCSTENDVSVIDLTEEDSDEDRIGGGADSESSSSGACFSSNVLKWRSSIKARDRSTRTITAPSESQSASTSPSIIVLDSPPSRPNATPEDPRENGTSNREFRSAWSTEASTSRSKTSNPVPIGQKSVAPQSGGTSISPPKKRYATAARVAPNNTHSNTQSPSDAMAALSANDVSAALMASSFLNGSAGSTSNNQSSSSRGNFGCGIPLLSAMTGMDFNDSSDPYSFGRMLANANSNYRMPYHPQSMNNHAYMAGTSSSAAPPNIFAFPPPPLRFGPTGSGYYMNTNPYGGSAAYPTDFLSTASTSAAAMAAAAASNAIAPPGTDSIWDNRWNQDFQDFLNSCLPDSSSRSS